MEKDREEKNHHSEKIEDIAFEILTNMDRESLREEGAEFYNLRNTILAIVEDEGERGETRYRIYRSPKRDSNTFKLEYTGTREEAGKWRKVIQQHEGRLP